MTPDPMHIILGGGCLVMTGLTLHLYRLLVIARAECRTVRFYREMQRQNGKKGAEKRQPNTEAMTEQLKREVAEQRQREINSARMEWGL